MVSWPGMLVSWTRSVGWVDGWHGVVGRWLARCGGSVDGELAWCAGKLDTVSWLGRWTVSWPGVLASWTRSVGWAVVGLGELGWWK
ncbi:hypothetical protein TIFTF001_043243 [Ficus carica]|uniref:Uncharacterized protein n=1 Tax=Ficus carica TaxID=3494 RepID=A0AA87YX99_FICCA|nr:hypothetical protein TIFTF001_043233 [Ficus carica]GMN21117.1 hypothetical protein TIFTF001_043237 [Ficus carica]GMN21128.1 hypothetical protein TIFTF001_043239 [Ficus carica]GMN21139.1 hypothetical protein TIFTF001_043243 [Ficus carica]